jgi:hypothetical protein
MEQKKGYVVLEVGYEYNDEYYHTGNYGTTYEAPKKVFISHEKAEEEFIRLTTNKLRGEDLGRYGEEGVRGICKDGKADEFMEIFRREFDKVIDEYDEIAIPQKATDEQLAMIIECLEIEFFEIVEIEIE